MSAKVKDDRRHEFAGTRDATAAYYPCKVCGQPQESPAHNKEES